MNLVNIYTDLDSLWDTRRAVLESLFAEGIDWDKDFAPIYRRRKIDRFEREGLGFTQAQYEEAFDKRDLTLFERGVSPSSLLNKIFTVVLDIENYIGKPINIGTFNITVNIFPYVVPDELLAVLKQSIESAIVFNHEVTLVSVNTDKLTPDYFRPYTHVFKYDALGKNSQPLVNNLKDSPIPNTKFFIPDLFQKDPESGMVAEPEELIQKMGIFLSGAITLVPVRHQIYDYRGSE